MGTALTGGDVVMSSLFSVHLLDGDELIVQCTPA